MRTSDYRCGLEKCELEFWYIFHAFSKTDIFNFYLLILSVDSCRLFGENG
jgi:hypothetical protein